METLSSLFRLPPFSYAENLCFICGHLWPSIRSSFGCPFTGRIFIPVSVFSFQISDFKFFRISVFCFPGLRPPVSDFGFSAFQFSGF
jgi:hypothetical protein